MPVEEFTLKAIFDAEDRISGKIGKVQRSLGDLADAGERSGDRLKAVFSSLGRVAEIALGFSLSGAISKAIDFAKEGVDVYASFESSTLKLAVAARSAGQDIGQLAEAFRVVASAAAREFNVTAGEAAATMEALVKAGLSAEDTMEALGSAILLAKNEGVSFSEAGNNLVQVLAQFGLSGGEAARVVDVLTNASRLGVGTANDFARGLANAAATAKGLGLDLEDTVSWLVVLERRLGSADEAGTVFNRFLLDLREIAEKLGVPLQDTSGRIRDMNDVILEVVSAVRAAGGDLATLQERLTGVDMRALKALLTFSQMTEGFEELRGEVGRGGAAMEAFAATLETTTGKLERQRAEIDRLQRSLGEGLAGIYTMVGPLALKAANAVVTPWRGIVAYFAGDEFQQLSAAVETQLHMLGRITEEEAAAWIASWVEAGKITRAEALEIAGSLLSLSTIARSELGAMLQEALAAGEQLPPALHPLTEALQSMADGASKSRTEVETLAARIKAFSEDAGIVADAAKMFAQYYDVVLSIEKALGREVQLTEEAARSKERLTATTQLLSLMTQSFGLVQQAVQLYMLGGKEAGDMLVNTMTGLVSATEDGVVTHQEFIDILGQLGVKSNDVASSLHSMLKTGLEAVKAAVEGNIEKAREFNSLLDMLNGKTIHTYHYHHQITVTGSARPPPPTIPQTIAAQYGIPTTIPEAQRGMWRVPADMPVYLHRGEMVLPPKLAEWLRAKRRGVEAINVVVNVSQPKATANEIAKAVSRAIVTHLRGMGA
ncbi:MAG: phage tail tape measure protein [Nitrososphaerota archaeon]